MQTQIIDDGSIEVRESWPVLRLSCALAAPAVVLVVLFAEWVNDSMRSARLIGGGLGTIGLLLVAAVVEDRNFRFDARRRELGWVRRNWFRRRSGVVPFADIRSVAVVKNAILDDSSNRPRTTFAAYVNTANEVLLLPGGESPDRTALDSMVGAIQKLLGTATETRGQDPVKEWVRAGRLIEAIQHLREMEGLDLADARERVHEIQRSLR